MHHERVAPRIEMGYQLLLESAAGEIAGLCENVELVNAMARYHHIYRDADEPQIVSQRCRFYLEKLANGVPPA